MSNIRFYEKKGLLTPSRNKESQYRDFSEDDVERLKKIIVLRKAGISVEKISLLFSGHIAFYEVLCSQEEEIREQMKQLEGAAALCGFMKSEKNVETMDVERYFHYMQAEEQQGKHSLGCLLMFLPFLVMICLFRVIRGICGGGTVRAEYRGSEKRPCDKGSLNKEIDAYVLRYAVR